MMELTEESIERRLAMTAPPPRGLVGYYALTVVVVGGLAALALWGRELGVPVWLRVILPWGLFLILVIVGTRASRRYRRFRQTLHRALKHVQLEEWAAAVPLIDQVLQKPIRMPSDRGQALLLLAASAEQAKDYAAAGRVYEAMATRRIGDALQTQQAAIALAATKLRTGELTDAVDLLGRLERVQMPQALKAVLDFVRLFQQVSMGHSEDAVKDVGERKETFRQHMSTRAGYGYGLIAAAMHVLGRTEEAATFWRDATLLIGADRLTSDFELLGPIKSAYPATEHPI